MTPDLTTSQTIGLASAIVGFCLTVFFTTLIVLTYGHRIRQYLRNEDCWFSPDLRHLPTYPSTMSSSSNNQNQPEGNSQTWHPTNARQRLLGPHNDASPPTSPPRPRSSYRIGRSLAHGTPPLDPAMFQPQPPTTGTYWPDTGGSMNTLPPYPEPRVPQRAVVPNRPRPQLEHPRPIPVLDDDPFQIPIDLSDSDASSDVVIERLPNPPAYSDPLPFADEDEDAEPHRPNPERERPS